METFSRLVLETYRAARETPLAQFQDAALSLIKPLLKFDSSTWGAVSTAERRIEMHHVHLHNEPPELIQAYLEVQHQDHAARALMKNRKLSTMGIAPATVRNYIQTIHEKLRVGGKAELIAQLNLAD